MLWDIKYRQTFVWSLKTELSFHFSFFSLFSIKNLKRQWKPRMAWPGPNLQINKRGGLLFVVSLKLNSSTFQCIVSTFFYILLKALYSPSSCSLQLSSLISLVHTQFDQITNNNKRGEDRKEVIILLRERNNYRYEMFWHESTMNVDNFYLSAMSYALLWSFWFEEWDTQFKVS